jgi:hypothetical protein
MLQPSIPDQNSADPAQPLWNRLIGQSAEALFFGAVGMGEVRKFPGQGENLTHPRDYSTGNWQQIPTPLLELAVKIHESRTIRGGFFSDDVLGEAPWNMLLALYIARGRGYRLKVSDACYESQVPATTALRWIEHLVNEGWAERRPNHLDARSFLVEITEEGVRRMTAYLGRTSEILSR